jgi:hypothetical protein
MYYILESNLHVLVNLNLHVTAALFGLIWTIQLVHYPSFIFIDSEKYQSFQKFHMQRITWIVAPLMILEGVLSIILLWYFTPNEVTAFKSLFSMPYGLSFLLVLILWLSTLCIQTPLHMKLEHGYDRGIVRKLVRSNWLRTIAWTLKLGILFLY